jgi:hypothetical protein
MARGNLNAVQNMNIPQPAVKISNDWLPNQCIIISKCVLKGGALLPSWEELCACRLPGLTTPILLSGGQSLLLRQCHLTGAQSLRAHCRSEGHSSRILETG